MRALLFVVAVAVAASAQTTSLGETVPFTEQIAANVSGRMAAAFEASAQQLLRMRAQVRPLADSNTRYTLETVWGGLMNNSAIDEMWAADNSDAGSYTMVDIDGTGGAAVPPLVVLKNASYSCLQYFRLDPITLGLTNASRGEGCHYNAMRRTWWWAASAAAGQVAMTPMMSLAQAPIATLMLTVMWTQNNQYGNQVSSTLTSAMTSERLSRRLADACNEFGPGTMAFVYEVGSTPPGKVVAASWPGVDLVDEQHYNGTHVNPHLVIPNVGNLTGPQMIMDAITLVGGPAALVGYAPPTFQSASNGDKAYVRQLSMASIPGANLRMLVAVPDSPSYVARGIQAAMSDVLVGAARQLINLKPALPPISDRDSRYTLLQVWNAMRASPMVGEMWAADNSDAGTYAMVAVDRVATTGEPPIVMLKNTSLSCLKYFALDTARVVAVDNYSRPDACNYAPMTSDWWTVARATRPNAAIMPMQPLPQDNSVAALMITVGFDANSSLSATPVQSAATSVITAAQLSQRLASAVVEAPGAQALMYEVTGTPAGKIIAASWAVPGTGDAGLTDLVHTPDMPASVEAAIADFGGIAALTLNGVVPEPRYILEGAYYASVAEVTSPRVPNLTHRVVVVVPGHTIEITRNPPGMENNGGRGPVTNSPAETHRVNKKEAFEGLLVLLILCMCGIGIAFFCINRKKKEEEEAKAATAEAPTGGVAARPDGDHARLVE